MKQCQIIIKKVKQKLPVLGVFVYYSPFWAATASISDLDTQNNIIENNLQIMQKQIKEANTLKIKSSKVYKTIGVITGLIIVVIFI